MTLADLYHDQLLQMRKRARPEEQDLLAPLEHKAFAREYTRENPWAAPGLAAAIPAYQLAKLFNLVKSRSKPSLDQMFAGYEGLFQGLNRRKGV